MIRLLILCSWMFLIDAAAGADEPPTFIIESERFSMGQANDYRIGNFDRELSEAEILKILDEHAYERTDRYKMDYQRYMYFFYLVDNRSGRTQTVYLRYPLWFPKTMSWLLQDHKLVPMHLFPRWGDNFYIDLPPGVHRIVGMRLSEAQQEGKATGVKILDFESLLKEWKAVEIIFGGVFGAVVTMIFYNLGMYLVYRRIYFLFYALYSGSSTYALAITSGYVPYNMPVLSVAGLIASFSLLLFCNSSLNVKQKFPRLFWASLVCALISTALSVYSMRTGHWLGFSLNLPIIIGFCCVTSVFSWRGGYRPALYFVLGWGIFLICCSLVVLNVAFWSHTLVNYFAIFGFAAEISLFSFAIGQKVRLAEQEALRGNQHAFNQLKKVFYPHQISKIKEGLSLEDTMPTSQGKACAICFDIISSSRIESTLGRTFIEDSVKACISALADHYDAEGLTASGYRVKEVGDGFLCTVGYPFRTVDGKDAVIGAMELAYNFVKIFQRQVDGLASQQLIFCSVGLAFGEIQGHFPKVGVAEYEVDGHAVDLAQRYESFRKRYFPEVLSGHIITVHAALFEQLPSHLQKGFIKVDLHKAQIVMRDDPGVTHLYYLLLSPHAVRDNLQISA